MKIPAFISGLLFISVLKISAQTVFLTEDFESGFPAAWIASPSSPPTNAWTVPGFASSLFVPPAHTIYAAINDNANPTALNPAVKLITPSVNLSAATIVYLQFDSYFLLTSPETAIINYSFDNGVTWNYLGDITPLTTDWKTNELDISTLVAGHNNVKFEFLYSDGNASSTGVALDNIKIYTPATSDASLVSLTPANGSPASFGVVASNVTVGGVIKNEGLDTITSIMVKYTDGISVYSDNITSISVPIGMSYTFTHTIPYTIPSTGMHPLTVWIEFPGDSIHTNDTLNIQLTGVLFTPAHAVTLEDANADWCGWSPRGLCYMDSIHRAYPNTCNIISVHDGDPMVNTIYDQGVISVIPGWPSILVNRSVVSDPLYSFDEYNNSIGNFGYADLYPSVSYDTSTRIATVNISAHFAADLSGDYRFAVVFTEDSVHGIMSSYNQANFYSFQSQNIPMSMPGMNFQTNTQPVPAAQMYYSFIARVILGGYNGQVGSLPTTIPAGSTQNYSFNWTIPAAYNENHMKAVVLLMDINSPTTAYIMNSVSTHLPTPLGIENHSTDNQLSLYPNPAGSDFTFSFTQTATENSVIVVKDVLGKIIMNQVLGILPPGNYQAQINSQSWSDGIYFVSLLTEEGVFSRKIEIVK
ncbi:MAG TPA: T9SS type A sorting domain-containing protein [Bacteroidia bacterium]|nr:T9SS type A sorting domain-containing protein [Bacteroidia bacterium]